MHTEIACGLSPWSHMAAKLESPGLGKLAAVRSAQVLNEGLTTPAVADSTWRKRNTLKSGLCYLE
jgi:hypothetical protein